MKIQTVIKRSKMQPATKEILITGAKISKVISIPLKQAQFKYTFQEHL